MSTRVQYSVLSECECMLLYHDARRCYQAGAVPLLTDLANGSAAGSGGVSADDDKARVAAFMYVHVRVVFALCVCVCVCV